MPISCGQRHDGSTLRRQADLMVVRPSLSPGARLVRHDARHVRVGRRFGGHLPDVPAVRALVAAMDGTRDAERVCQVAATSLDPVVEPAALMPLLEDLMTRGVVVDASAWPLDVPRDETHSALLRGRDPGRLRGRRRYRIVLHAESGADSLPRLIEPAASLGGLDIGLRYRSGTSPDLLVMTSVGEPSRDEVGSACRTVGAVLPVTLDEGCAVVGPWIQPGRTPCLNCADLDRSRWDRSWSSYLPPIDRAMRPHGVGIDVLQAVSLLVVSDALADADGRRPRTVGSRWTVGPDPSNARRDPVGFSSRCMCHLLSDVS